MIVKILKLFVPVLKTKRTSKYAGKKHSNSSKSLNKNVSKTWNRFNNFLAKNKLYVFLLAFLATISLMVSNFIVLSIFIIIGIASRYYQKYLPHLSFGIETCLFGAVFSSLAYGWHAGASVGIIALTISVFLTEEEASYLPVALLGMAGVAFIASIAPITAANIVFWGVLLTVIYDIATCGIYIYLFHADIFKTGIFIMTHIAFNYFLFVNFGVYVYGLLM